MNIQRKPEWLKVKLPLSLPEKVRKVSSKYRLNTVCKEAACPNIHECWDMGTATFMILGNRCTRNCGFCKVKHDSIFQLGASLGIESYRLRAEALRLDIDEPKRIADAVRELGLRHSVITSVTRDDLPDGGASVFAETIRIIRDLTSSTIEVLIPDFQGSMDSLRIVTDARPDILGHNIETVKRLYHSVRAMADYDRSLGILRSSKNLNKNILTKAGILIGMGEEEVEVIETMKDIRDTGCDIITIGQYLPPSKRHFPLAKYYTPEEFKKFELIGRGMGFIHIESGPLVRSSYHARYPYSAFP